MANVLAYLSFYLAAVYCIASPSPVLAAASLNVGFYQKTCPAAETIVNDAVNNALAADPGVPAALIRLHFHDCFVRGCDGSVLLDSTANNTAEKDSSMNLGIGGFDVIDAAKAALEAKCPGTISCADTVAFAARDSVLIAGGAHYSVPAGRRDGRISRATDAAKNLPGSFSNVAQLKTNFARKGLSLAEMVTLSGAHSIGDSHCSAFSKRLYSFRPGNPQDTSFNSTYASFLKTKCPRTRTRTRSGAIIDPIVSLDPLTPVTLDNNYYKNIKIGMGLLASDQVLWTTPVTRTMVKSNLNHPSAWAQRFAAAMVSMGSIEVLTGQQGEIRKNCRVVN